jgi:dTDP-glucose pyrophosphorylase
MNIVITMSGAGERFRHAGYNCPKHEIVWRGRTLFDWSLASLRRFFGRCPFVLVTRDFPGVRDFIAHAASRLGLPLSDLRIEVLDRPTRGQAETALLARPHLAPHEPVLIYNIDTHVCPEALNPGDITGDGWIPVFEATGDRWSFVELGPHGRAVRVTEKQRISNHCSVGLYHFRSFTTFADLARGLEGQQAEWYVAPLYNGLIARGGDVRIHTLPPERVMILGTPEDLLQSERSYPLHADCC